MKTKGLIILAFLLVMGQLFAQEGDKRFGFELSGGSSFAFSELAGFDLKPGFGFEGTFHYRLVSNFGVYAGWGWNRHAAKEAFEGETLDFEETGYVFGIQYARPIGSSALKYYVRGGGLFNHIETENSDGDIIDDTGHGLGWQLAAGLEVPLSDKLKLTPGIKINSLNRESDYFGELSDMNLKYLSLRIGLIKMF